MRRQKRSISLAILCGGYSSRFGSDKGLFNPLGDEPIVARFVRLFEKQFSEIFIVVRNSSQADLYRAALAKVIESTNVCQIEIICDSAFTTNSPNSTLVGVYSALKASRNEQIVILPIDGLGVKPIHLKKLITASSNHEVVCFKRPDTNEEAILPFPSIWRKSTAVTIEGKIKDSHLGIISAIKTLNTSFVDPVNYLDELLVNANTKSEAIAYFGRPLFDPFGRRLHYLRFSLTEACNMSCLYCLPKGFPEWYRHKARLSTDDIKTVLDGFRQLGFRKVRFTGGEPTVHSGCLNAIKSAREFGYEEIALTTNGVLLKNLESWIDAGLNQLNISLDSLDVETFEEITRNSQLTNILNLIDSAIDQQIEVKINTVLMRSINGSKSQISELIDWAVSKPITLRFIELMDTKLNHSFAAQERVLGNEIAEILANRGFKPIFSPHSQPLLGGPATDYWHPDYEGRVGLINPLSCNFCNRCNRLRVTARAELKLCLFGDDNHKLDLSSAAALQDQVRVLIEKKPDRHFLESGKFGNVATFRTIGG